MFKRIKLSFSKRARERERERQLRQNLEAQQQRYLNTNQAKLAFQPVDDANTLLDGKINCAANGDVEVNEANVSSLLTCFQQKYEENAGICSLDQNFQYYPNTPEKLLEISKLNFDGQTPNTLNNYTRYISNLQNALVEQLKDPNLYTQDAHKDRISAAYNQCLGFPVPPISEQTMVYPGFDCCVFNMERSIYQRAVGGNYSLNNMPLWRMDFMNHVVLPNLNYDRSNIASKLGIPDSWVTRNRGGRSRSAEGVREHEYIYTHIQGTMKFNKTGHYYIRFISDDGAAFMMENQNRNGDIYVENYLGNGAWKPQPATKYYAHIHIKNIGNIPKYAKNTGYNYNIGWCNGHGPGVFKVQYIYTGDDNSYDDIRKLESVPENQYKLLNNERSPNPEMVSYRLKSINGAQHMMLSLKQNPENVQGNSYILRAAFQGIYLYNKDMKLMTNQSEDPATRIDVTGGRLNNNEFKVIPGIDRPISDANDFARRLMSGGRNGRNFEIYMTRRNFDRFYNMGVSAQFRPLDIGAVKVVWRYGGATMPTMRNQYLLFHTVTGAKSLRFILPFMNNMEIQGTNGQHSYSFSMFPISPTQNKKMASESRVGYVNHTPVPN
jgi:hypothetical protein